TGVTTPTFPTSGNNVTATFFGAGIYTFQVTVTDSFGLSSKQNVIVTVLHTPTSVIVKPETSSITVGGTDQLTATAFDQFGNDLAVQPSSWNVTSGPGTISSSGLYTAPSGINGNNQKAVIQASFQYTDPNDRPAHATEVGRRRTEFQPR